MNAHQPCYRHYWLILLDMHNHYVEGSLRHKLNPKSKYRMQCIANRITEKKFQEAKQFETAFSGLSLSDKPGQPGKESSFPERAAQAPSNPHAMAQAGLASGAAGGSSAAPAPSNPLSPSRPSAPGGFSSATSAPSNPRSNLLAPGAPGGLSSAAAAGGQRNVICDCTKKSTCQIPSL